MQRASLCNHFFGIIKIKINKIKFLYIESYTDFFYFFLCIFPIVNYIKNYQID